jgi:flagellar L-ring protein precursor FlgH
MRPALIVLAALALAPLAACSTVTEAVKGPELAPVGYPAQLAPMTQQYVSSRDPAPQAASANSLWRWAPAPSSTTSAPARSATS